MIFKIIFYLIFKVLSGDTFVIFDENTGNEQTLKLFNIYSPKLARKSHNYHSSSQQDEPYAWEAREFLRKHLVGRKVTYQIRFTMDEYRIFVIAYLSNYKPLIYF